MDTSTIQQGDQPLVFDVRGVTFHLYGVDQLPAQQRPESYACSRMPQENGRANRISNKGLIVELNPDGIDSHDTFINPGVEVGTGVIFGAHSHFGEGVVVGPGTKIGRGCDIGRHSHIGGDVEIGDDNIIPQFVTIANGVKIPDGLLKFGVNGPTAKDMMMEIDQPYIDSLVAARAALVR